MSVTESVPRPEKAKGVQCGMALIDDRTLRFTHNKLELQEHLMTSSSGSRRAGPYVLSAIADLQTRAGESPRLRAILFMASNEEDSHTWRASNLGTFVTDFAFLVDAGEAYKLYQRLCHGEKVTFPGMFDLDILKDRLGG
jgi:hypothetical protein